MLRKVDVLTSPENHPATNVATRASASARPRVKRPASPFRASPQRRPIRSFRTLVLAVLLASVASGAGACNIPVFRYALERWKPDTCEIIVFENAQSSADASMIIDRWNVRTIENGGHANAKVIRVDIDAEKDQQRRDLWQDIRQDPDATLPHVLVRTKLGRGHFVNHWHGTLTEADRLSIFQSPARTEVRNRLLAGHSVVWLLIGSKDDQKTRRARELAEETFKTLAPKITLPEGIGLPGSELYADVPLVLRFSLLEIDPADPNEAFLVRLLSGLRLEAFEQGEPLLIPVFGRGRALEVIPARDMSARLMEELTVFLSGACSCQVKEQNPGFDLLMDADWDGELFGDESNRPPDRSAEEGQNRNPVLVPIPQGRK